MTSLFERISLPVNHLNILKFSDTVNLSIWQCLFLYAHSSYVMLSLPILHYHNFLPFSLFCNDSACNLNNIMRININNNKKCLFSGDVAVVIVKAHFSWNRTGEMLRVSSRLCKTRHMLVEIFGSHRKKQVFLI